MAHPGSATALATLTVLVCSCAVDSGEVRLSGVVQASPVIVVSPADGVLGEIHHRAGQSVLAGAPLATIESPAVTAEVERLQLALGSAKRAVDLARRQRERVASELKLLKASPAGVLRRVEGGRLVEESSEVSGLRWDLAQDRLAFAEAKELSAQTGWQQAAAALKLAQDQAARLELLSPIAGSVALISGPEGRPVRAGEHVVTIYDLSDLWVEVWVEESIAPRVSVGEVLSIELAGDREIEGRVQSVSAEAGFAVQRDVDRVRRDIRALRVRVRLEGDGLLPGMSADVRIR